MPRRCSTARSELQSTAAQGVLDVLAIQLAGGARSYKPVNLGLDVVRETLAQRFLASLLQCAERCRRRAWKSCLLTWPSSAGFEGGDWFEHGDSCPRA